jgi:hypothetical protein
VPVANQSVNALQKILVSWLFFLLSFLAIHNITHDKGIEIFISKQK